MKRMFTIGLLVLSAAGSFAEATAQPAFRLLDGYLDKRSLAAEYGAKNGSWVLMGSGVVLGAASATLWFAGDSLAEAAHAPRLSPEVKLGTSVGLAIGALVIAGIGYALQISPPAFDERIRFSAIYRENDPVVQEALAAARLESLAEAARTTRLVSGWVNVISTAGFWAFQSYDNGQKGLAWSDGLADRWGWQAGTVVGGVTNLLVKSEEEALFEEYRAVVARLTKD